ncbi:unnamed protein product, partial [Notodromas monacha]
PDVEEDAIFESGLNLGLISRNVNASAPSCLVVKSHNAGRFLCEFTYFTSMCVDKTRVAFVHVPPLGIYSAEEVADTLKMCIGEMLQQLFSSDGIKERDVS